MWGSESAVKAQMRVAFTGANQIFEDSGVDVQLSMIWPQKGIPPATDYQLYDPGVGNSRIHMDLMGTDYVMMVMPLTGGGGFATINGITNVLNPTWGFSGLILAHEYGHSCGASHDRGHSFTGNDGKLYNTAMLVNSVPGGTTIPRMSNRNQFYKGARLGDSFSDMATFMVPRIQAISGFRKLKPQNGPGDLLWSIKNRVTKKVISSYANSLNQGTPITQYDNFGVSSQTWRIVPGTLNNEVVFRSAGSFSKYLGMTSTGNGAGATVEPWSGPYGTFTRFYLETNVRGFTQLKNLNSDKVLYPSGPDNSAQLRQWQDFEQDLTQWSFDTVN